MIVLGLAIGFTIPVGNHLAPAAQAVAAAGEEDVVPHETTLARASNGHFYTYATVNGKMVHFVVDTGATDVALTIDDARMAGIKVDPARFQVVGSGASGDVVGQLVSLEEVDLDGKRVHDIRGMVLQGLGVSLLGQNYLRGLKTVAISGDTMTLR